MLIDHGLYCFIYKRASFEAYKKFKINKLELWLLCALSSYLQYKNAVVIGKDTFFTEMTGNGREQLKMEGPMLGLIKKGFVGSFEYVRVPGSTSVGLSDLGISTLRCYDEALQVFADKFAQSPYRIKTQISITEEPLPYYNARTA